MDEKTKQRNERLAAELYPQPKKDSRTFWRVSQLATTPPTIINPIQPNYIGLFKLGVLFPVPLLAGEWVLWRITSGIGTTFDVLIASLFAWLFLTVVLIGMYFFMRMILGYLNTYNIPDNLSLFYFYIFFMAPVAIGLQLLLGYDNLGLLLSSIVTMAISAMATIGLAKILYRDGKHVDTQWRQALYLILIPYAIGLLYGIFRLIIL